MQKLAKHSLDHLRETIVKRLLVAMLTIATLSGAGLVTLSSPATAHGCGGVPGNTYDCE